LSETSTTPRTEPSRPELLTPRRPVGVEGRRRAIRGAILSVVGVLIVAVAAIAISRSAIFSLRHLDVSGNQHLSDAEVARLAGLSAATNVLWLSTGEAQGRLLRDPWIASASLSRALPSSVGVKLTERSPVALASAPSGGPVLIAGDGVVLGPAPSGTRLPAIQVPPNLTLQLGSRVPSNLPALRAAAGFPPAVAARTATVSVGRDGIEVHTRDGIRVIYGDTSVPDLKGTAIEAVLVWLQQHHIEPVYIDVSAPTTPAVLPLNGELTGILIAVPIPPPPPPSPVPGPSPEPSATGANHGKADATPKPAPSG
jgi:cell division septal protein FtsQ